MNLAHFVAFKSQIKQVRVNSRYLRLIIDKYIRVERILSVFCLAFSQFMILRFPPSPDLLPFNARIIDKKLLFHFATARVTHASAYSDASALVIVESGAKLVKLARLVTGPVRSDLGADSNSHLLLANVAEEND